MASTTTTPNPAATEAPLMISVSGVRGIVGATMTPVVAAQFAAAFGTWLKRRSPGDDFVVCLGRDSRPSGLMINRAASSGLMSIGATVIDLGVVATPTVGIMIDRHNAAGGMMITASHNPIQWNGMKSLNSDGLAPPVDEASQIIERFHKRDFEYVSVHKLQQSRIDDRGNALHVEKVLAAIDPEPIRSARFKVVLDSVNGAGCVAGRSLLEQLGCEIVHINGDPTGQFAHTPEPVKENLTQLATVVAKEGAAVGFAQDPDADRLAIVDENGTYIGEEYTLALAAWRVFKRSGGGATAANLSTSRMIDDVAAKFPGSSVERTAVGEANVVASLKSKHGVIGGEGNGGVIYPPVCWVRDSLGAMALVLALMADKATTVSELVAELPKYAMVKTKYDLSNIGGAAVVPAMLQRVAEQYANERMNASDGVRVDFADGWVHLRPSNTEPIVRLIAEAESETRANELVKSFAACAGL